jgi:hypothetical protein
MLTYIDDHGIQRFLNEIKTGISPNETIYSYLMGVQAIEQNIFPEVLERPKCSIALIWSFPIPQEKYFDLLPALPLITVLL